MIRGDVHWVDFPGAGRRPGLIVTRDAAIALLGAVLAVPATRTIRGIPSEVLLEAADGLPGRCALSFDNITPVPKRLVGERITTLSRGVMEEVCEALRFAISC